MKRDATHFITDVKIARVNYPNMRNGASTTDAFFDRPAEDLKVFARLWAYFRYLSVAARPDAIYALIM